MNPPSFPVPAGSPLADGDHSFTATATVGGIVSAPTGAYPITVDTIAPGAATDVSLIDDVGPQTGEIHDNDTTDDANPTYSGKAEPGASVVIYQDGVAVKTVPVNGNGDWTYTPDTPLLDGPHQLSNQVVDAAGNSSPISAPTHFIVDTSAVTISITQVDDNVGSVTGPISNHGVTDDTTPTVHGKATANSLVHIYVDGNPVAVGSVMANQNGDWEFTPTLTEGPHAITATSTNAAGVVSGSNEFDLTVDTTAPGKPVIGDIQDNVGTITGTIPDHGSTDDTTPTVGGGGQTPGDTVTIIDNGKPIGTAIVGDDGNWEFTPNPPLNQGEHEIVVVVTDPAGNTSEPSDPWTVIVDTDAPGKVVITSVVDNAGAVTGDLNPGDTTDDSLPVINGRAEPNSIVSVYDGTTFIGTAQVNAAGDWSMTPNMPLLNGMHHITAVAADAAGNVGEASDPFDFNLIAGGTPPAPAITSVVDDVGSITGNIQKGGVTDDTQPTVNGTAQPGSRVSLYDGATLVGTATAQPDGSWSIEPSPPLSEGTHDLHATATNAAGNVSAPTGDYPIVVDTTAPLAPTGQSLTDDVGAITGPINNGDTTDDANPTFAGKAEPGSTVTIYDNGVPIDSVKADPNGDWTYTPKTALADGPHEFAAQATDPAGNTGPMGPAIDFTVDTSAVVISITSVVDDQGPVTGNLSSGQSTDDTTPTINGKATPNSLVTLYDGTTVIGSVVAEPDGSWTIQVTAPALTEGTHNLTATSTSPVTGESAPTAAFDLVIDTTAPVQPTIDGAEDDVGTIQGNVVNGGVTDDTTPTLHGTGEPGSHIDIYDGSTLVGTATVATDGSWNSTLSPLNDGQHDFTVIATDAAGNASVPSADYVVTVDTAAPVAPTITGALDDFGTKTGNVASGGVTDDRTPTLSGTAEANSVVVIRDGGVAIGSAKTESDGSWKFDVPARTGDQLHTFTAVAQDAAGNVSPVSNNYNLTFDTTAPTAPTITGALDDFGTKTGNVASGGVTDDRTPTLSGTAEANSVVVIRDGGVAIGSAKAESDGSWKFDVPARTGDQLHTFTAVAQDAAGNVSPVSNNYNLTFDTTAPAAPTITGALDNFGAVTGNVSSGGNTDDTTPTLSGKAEANSTVTIYTDGGVNLGTAHADGNGDWHFTTPLLGLGAHSYQVTATDTAGNSSGLSNRYSVNVVPPAGGENFNNWNPATSGVVMSGGQIINHPLFGPIWVTGTSPGGAAGSFRVTFKESPSHISFDLDAVNETGTTVTYFDQNGAQIGIVGIPPNGNGTSTFTYDAPAGHTIGSFVVNTPEGSGVGIDNINWSTPGITSFGMETLSDTGSDTDNLVHTSTGNDDQDPSDSVDDVPVSEQPFILHEDVQVHVEQAGDTHVLTIEGAGQVLDLSALTAAEQVKIDDVKVIDITGTGDNTLKLSLNDVLEQGGKGLFIDDDKTQMMIKGDAGDVVELNHLLPEGADGGDWTQSAGAVTVEGVAYNVFQNSAQNVELLVQQGVETHLV